MSLDASRYDFLVSGGLDTFTESALVPIVSTHILVVCIRCGTIVGVNWLRYIWELRLCNVKVGGGMSGPSGNEEQVDRPYLLKEGRCDDIVCV